jgi:ABC-type glycerol-3-phosphate transport system substrate-binding protein
MEEVYFMEIIYDQGIHILEDDDLAEYWANSYFIENDLQTNLLFNGRLYENISELRFRGSPMEADELEIWLSWEGIDEIKEEIKRFSTFHKLSVNTVEVPRPESKLISVVRARGELPDLVMLQSSAVESLVQSRSIQNLDYISFPDLVDQGRQAFTLENKLWGMPFYSDTQIIFYNKGLISELPHNEWTLKEMENLARQQKNRNINPLVWNAYSVNWFVPFQSAFGKTALINSEGEITVNDLASRKALEYIIRLKTDGLLVPMERDAMNALFISGKIAMIMSGSYAIPHFESLGLNFGILPFPLNMETGRNLSPLLDFKAFCMTRQTYAPILARRMLQYLSGPGVQQRFCPEMAKLPGRRNILNIPGIEYGYLNILEKTMETGTVIPPRHVYSIYKNNMWKLLRFALSGKMSVQETLNQGQILMENILRESTRK